MELYIDDTYYANFSTAPYSFNINTATLTDGARNFKVKAYDQAGNTGEDQRTIIIDNRRPIITITNPSDGDNVNSLVNIQVDASDNIQMDQVEIYLKGVLKVPDTTAPYQYTWDITWITNGTYIIKAIAHDKAGNPQSTLDIPVTVNHTIHNVSSSGGVVDTKDITPVNNTVYWKYNHQGTYLNSVLFQNYRDYSFHEYGYCKY